MVSLERTEDGVSPALPALPISHYMVTREKGCNHFRGHLVDPLLYIDLHSININTEYKLIFSVILSLIFESDTKDMIVTSCPCS